MKKLFFCIALLSFLASCVAQERLQKLGSPKTGVQVSGKLVVDSVVILPVTKALTNSLRIGALMYQISDSSLNTWTGFQWLKQAGGGGGGTANLTKTLTANDITVNNSNGTGIVIPSSDGTSAGLVPASKYNEWNNKLSTVDVGVSQGSGSVAITSTAGGGGTISAVDASKAGVVTPSMKTVWDGKISTVNVGGSITGNGNGTPATLIGDVGAPGANIFYGTNALGQKGWWTPPGGGGGSGSTILTTIAALDASSALATDKIYWITDTLKQGPFQYVGTVADQSSDNGGTIIVNAGLQQFKRIYTGGIDARWFGMVADGLFAFGVPNKASPGGGDARALNAAIKAAAKEEIVYVPSYNSNYYYIDTTVLLTGGSLQAGGINRNLQVYGNYLVAANTVGFKIEGSKHNFFQRGIIYGPNGVATDSTTYAGFNGTGVLIKNCLQCVVDVDRISDFKYGLRVAGESDGATSGTFMGSQYNTISAKLILHNYIQVWLTIDSTGTGGSNWCNSNTFYLKQVGGGTNAAAGGTFGIKMEKLGGASTSKFETNDFISTGIEGNQWGIYSEFSKDNSWFGMRLEDGAVTNKFWFRQDNTTGLSSINNLISGPVIYERYFQAGGIGDGTTVIGDINTTSTSKAGFMGSAKNGKFTWFSIDDPVTAWNESTGDIIAFNNLDGNRPDRYAIRMKIGGVDRLIPYEAGDTLITAATYAVSAGKDNVLVNRPSGVATITLPSASAYVARNITIRDAETSQTVTVAGTINSGDRTSISAGQSITYRSINSVWYDISNSGSGGGSFSLTAFGSTPSSTGASYSGGVYANQPADSTHPGGVSIGNQIWQGGKQIDSISTDVISLYKNGSGWLKTNITLRQNGFSINDNGTPNSISTVLTAYNFGSGSSSRDIMVGVGKTGVNFAGFGNNGTDFVLFGEKSTGGFDFRNTVGYASALLSSGRSLMKIFGTTGNVLIQTAGTAVDNGYKLDVQGTLHATGAVVFDNLAGASTQMVVAATDGTLGVQTIPAGGGGGSSIFTAGAGTGSPYYHSTGPVNIGINPSQSYAWTHWGASTTTRAVWEFAPTSSWVSAPRNHSVDYDALSGQLRLTSNNVSAVILTAATYAPFTGYYQGSPIGLGYLDAGSSNDGDPLVSNGSSGSRMGKAPVRMSYNQNSTNTVTNTVTATSIYGGTHTIPVTNLATTDEIEMKGSGQITTLTATTPNLTFGFRVNSTPINFTINSLTGGHTFSYKYEFSTTPITTGTTANGYSTLELTVYDETAGTEFKHVVQDISSTGFINTVAPTCNVLVTWSAASSSNTVTSRRNTVKINRAN